MTHDKRYGAFLILSLTLLAVFFYTNQKMLSTSPEASSPKALKPGEVFSFEPLPLSADNEASSPPPEPRLDTKAAEIVKEKKVPPPAKAAQKVPVSEKILPAFPIDLNRAGKDELMILPGVGEKTALRIIEKRDEIGGFKSVDDLTEIKWIGKVKLEKIRPFATVGQAPSE